MDTKVIQRVNEALHAKSDKNLRIILHSLDTPSVADLIDELSHGRRKTFAMLPPEIQADVVKLLSDSSRKTVLPRLPADMLARMMHFMDEDDATDVIQELPPKLKNQVMMGLQEHRRKRIEKLLIFGPETAGGIMDLNFVETDPEMTVHEATDVIHKSAKANKQVPVALFHFGKAYAWVPARVLISASKQAKLKDLAHPVSSVLYTADREEVLDLMSNANSDILCVKDEQEKLLGVIHLNDLLRIAEEEASEDVYRMGAVGAMSSSYLESKFSTIWKKRVGWLSILFIAELFTFTAMSRYEHAIDDVAALALFVPLCISTGGNSGSQASTLITRAMALGHVTTRDWWRVIKRELWMGIALGFALGIVGFVRAAMTPQSILGDESRWTMGIVIGQSVAAICLWGTLVGSMLPLVFKKIGFDPAYASSPFVATFVDVTGIVLYFSIASAYIFS